MIIQSITLVTVLEPYLVIRGLHNCNDIAEFK